MAVYSSVAAVWQYIKQNSFNKLQVFVKWNRIFLIKIIMEFKVNNAGIYNGVRPNMFPVY